VGQLPATVLKNFHFSAVSNLKSAVMPKTELKTDAANLALREAAIVGMIYGISFLLMPYSMFQLS
jgi:hypothetical protein